MGTISLRDVGLIAGDTLFQNLTLSLSGGDRLGLIAGNGGGKTSLLRMIAGQAEPSTGDIVKSHGLTIGYVEQDVPKPLLNKTFYDAILSALPPEAQTNESWRVDVVLDEFATPEPLRTHTLAELSGGWQRIALIARIWVNAPDALLLDEPTNHLDLSRIFALESWIAEHTRTIPVIIASHDRQFLDATTNRTLFLRPGLSRDFALPFTKAKAALTAADTADATANEKDLKQAKRLRKNAGELYNVGINSGSDLLLTKAKQLKARAAAIEDAQRDLHKDRSGDIKLANRGTHARVLLALENLTITTPPGEKLFDVPKLHVFQGDRIAILGRNGAGKTQLMSALHRALIGETVPGLRATPSLVVGYADQAMSQLPDRESPLGYITTRYDVPDQRAKSLLAAAGFVIEKQSRPIAQLSFGQRSRLGLLGLRLRDPNFYLLDEPTNHVDIAGQELLETEIIDHQASCILVSHDRAFLAAIATRYWQIAGKRLLEVDSPEPFYETMRATT